MTTNDERPGCLASLLSLLRLRPKPAATLRPEPLPYRTRDDFLSSGESSLYRLLSSHLHGRASVFPKVRLADVFFVARPNENMSYINRVSQRHVDFLICDASSLRPIAGVELDDSSHSRAHRRESDKFLNEVFTSASLPLVRIPARRQYATSEVASSLAALLPSVAAATPHAEPTAAPARGSVPEVTAPAHPPLCPKCGIPMVVRIAGQGEHKGKRFYGCSNYPRCRQAIALDR